MVLYAYVTLALMGGAGLAMTEALGVRGADIHHSTEGYTVRVVGRRARIIPVHADWERYLDEPNTHFIDGEHVLFPGQTPRGRETTLRTLYRGPHPAPNPQWLRDTWLLQLVRTLPLSIIMQAVGTSDVIRFRRYFDAAHLNFEQWHGAVRNPAAYRPVVNTTSDDIIASDGPSWRAVHERARVEATSSAVKPNGAPMGSAVDDAAESDSTTYPPRPQGRRRPRDQDHGKYARRPRRVDTHEQALTSDSTAVPAGTLAVTFRRGEQPLTADNTAIPVGTPAAPFERAASTEPPEGHGGRPVHKAGREPRRIEALEGDWSPKRSRKTSRYEALPPGIAQRPARAEEATAEGTFDTSDLMFAAIREGLLAEARRSARGGKR
ncbi:hypothetical protein [Curtobacterium sp. 1544]|uniref:hypothetical protein n=1 Tax=Curtobacterium sp. 1544 TaxID=3156417 RepID=UPI00339B14A0